MMLEWPVLATSIVIVALIVALVRELWPPALAVLGADIALLLLGVIDGDQAFSGFSNEAPIVVAALLIFARAVDVSGAIQPVVQHLFGTVESTRGILSRIVFPLATFSSVINNTTLVAMTVPAVMDVSQRRRWTLRGSSCRSAMSPSWAGCSPRSAHPPTSPCPASWRRPACPPWPS